MINVTWVWPRCIYLDTDRPSFHELSYGHCVHNAKSHSEDMIIKQSITRNVNLDLK